MGGTAEIDALTWCGNVALEMIEKVDFSVLKIECLKRNWCSKRLCT
jgi:hypothetical protein